MNKYNQLREEIINIHYKTFGYGKDSDINLEDCLVALNKIENCEYNGIRNDGHFLIDFGEKTAWTDNDKPIKWIMGKPLHQQKQETIDFLHSLIVEK